MEPTATEVLYRQRESLNKLNPIIKKFIDKIEETVIQPALKREFDKIWPPYTVYSGYFEFFKDIDDECPDFLNIIVSFDKKRRS